MQENLGFLSVNFCLPAILFSSHTFKYRKVTTLVLSLSAFQVAPPLSFKKSFHLPKRVAGELSVSKNFIDYRSWKFLEAKRHSKKQPAYIQKISEICT